MSKKKSVKGKADVERKLTKENLQYKFNSDELLTIGKELGEKQIQIRQLDDDRKKAADEWKSRISTAESEIASMSNKVTSGYEYRDIDCEVVLNDPPGKKTCRRLDTMVVVWVRELSPEEKQRTLELEEDPAGDESCKPAKTAF